MRERIASELGSVAHSGFLCYLMGPYESVGGSRGAESELVGEMVGLLRRLQGCLRDDPGVNAFLAVDVGIPLHELDAATQTMQFVRASNAVVFIVPMAGDNLGVGIELGAVLERGWVPGERVLIAHESSVSSAMLASTGRRWAARNESYDSERELVEMLRSFISQIMYEEATGRLPRMDE